MGHVWSFRWRLELCLREPASGRNRLRSRGHSNGEGHPLLQPRRHSRHRLPGRAEMWRRFRALGSSAIKAVAKAKHRCWEILGDATRLRPDVRVRWMPSHKTPDELSDLGVPRHWRAGNAEADERAKAAARQQDVPEELLQQYRVHAQQAERVANTVAAIQLRRLRARPRTAEGAAIKERLRQAPGLAGPSWAGSARSRRAPAGQARSLADGGGGQDRCASRRGA